MKRFVSAILALSVCFVAAHPARSSSFDVLYKFEHPVAQFSDPHDLLARPDGDLYGTAGGLGASGQGVAFKLSAPTVGQTTWTQTRLTSFRANTVLGSNPFGPLVADRRNRLYGVTTFSSIKSSRIGSIFRLSPTATIPPGWASDVLLDLHLPDDFEALGLVADNHGNLFVITGPGSGKIVRLTPRKFGGSLVPWNAYGAHSFADAATFPRFLTGVAQADGTYNLFGLSQGPEGGTPLPVAWKFTP